MKKTLSFLLPAFLIAVIISVSSCTSEKGASVLVTVLHNEIVLNPADGTYDTTAVPVSGASVRLWFDGGNIDETMETNTAGQAEFNFENPSILELQITYLTQQFNQSNVVIEEGDNIELEFNLDD